MLTLTLTRNSKNGNAVRGKMIVPLSQKPVRDKYGDLVKEYDATIDTLENADFIIPAGTYRLKHTWSPRFKKFLPILLNVPGREGIRIHRGTIPEHSRGCILTNVYGMSILTMFINRLEIPGERDDETNDPVHEDFQITIIDNF